jgi:hypothetical protein
MKQYKRLQYRILHERLRDDRRFIQVLSGPRQVGKTTLARQVSAEIGCPVHFASADEPTLEGRIWLQQQWDIARLLARDEYGKPRDALLVLDEAQKISGWSESVKRLWDEDTAGGSTLRVLLSGSSPLLLQDGLSESLAGRFEIIPVTHWSFEEMEQAFAWKLEQYIYFGGYPGAAGLIEDESRWRRYIIDSLIETTISRDILLMARVEKPALLRRLFYLGCEYSGQILSFNKMLGQLQDAGNTVTLAHYLDLLGGAGLVAGLTKYAGQKVRQRASSPKLLALNTGLMTALTANAFADVRAKPDDWGRIVETAIGAHLVNSSKGTAIDVKYWNRGNREVDYVLSKGNEAVCIEVKSGHHKPVFPGMEAFEKEFPVKRQLLVGGQGIALHEFLKKPAEFWVG